MQIFNLTELRANIGDDADTERMLLNMFLESTGESLDWLESHFPTDPNANYDAAWKTHMHQIKGAALNICAEMLCTEATEAERAYTTPLGNKKEVLKRVTACFRELESQIRAMLPKVA